MVLLVVKPVGRTLIGAGLATAGSVGAEVEQQSPASQPTFRRGLVPVQAAARVQHAIQPVGESVHEVARPMAARMLVTGRIFPSTVPEFLQRLANRRGPRLALPPATEVSHPLGKLDARRGPIDVPDAAVQLVVLADAVADLEEAVQ